MCLGFPAETADLFHRKLNGGETCSFKRSRHGKIRDFPVISLLVVFRLEGKYL